MLLIDDVKYELWMLPSEDNFERAVKEHSQDIFGENAGYFDLKQKLKTQPRRRLYPRWMYGCF